MRRLRLSAFVLWSFLIGAIAASVTTEAATNPSPSPLPASELFLGQWKGMYSGSCSGCASPHFRDEATINLRRDDAGNIVGEIIRSGRPYPIENARIQNDALQFRFWRKGGLSGNSNVENAFSLKRHGDSLEGSSVVSIADTGARWVGTGKFSMAKLLLPKLNTEIKAPTPDVPAQYAKFSGVWEGTAADGQPRAIIVREVSAEGSVAVAQAWGGTAPQWNVGKVFSYRGRIEGDRMVLTGAGNRYEFSLQGEKLRGGLVSSPGPENATFQRK